MSRSIKLEDALAFIQEHGIVLVSAKGDAVRLTEFIAGESIKGSWWAHPQSHAIFRLLNEVEDSGQVLVCRLVGGKLTMIHRRLWPSLARVAEHILPGQIARVQQVHTAAGRHENHETPFLQWVSDEIVAASLALPEQDAIAPFVRWVKSSSVN